MIADAILVAVFLIVPQIAIMHLDKVGLGPDVRSGGALGTTAAPEASTFSP